MKAARSGEADQGHIVILSLLPVVQLTQIKASVQTRKGEPDFTSGAELCIISTKA